MASIIADENGVRKFMSCGGNVLRCGGLAECLQGACLVNFAL
jgi:hypothetical protein